MKIVLAAINAKYIHSNLAVYSLRAYAKEYASYIEIGEFTINNHIDNILEELYKKQPGVLCISCYIWNIRYVEELIYEFHKLCPNVPIWLGGPEVSYEAETFLKQHPEVTGIMVGEGEETFRQLCAYYVKEEWNALDGIASIVNQNQMIATSAKPMNMSDIPFCYDNIEDFSNRIIYYESSRGCPFSCSYCLSSIDKQLRFRDLELVKQELAFFIEKNVPQIKFVDRTFNCNHAHAMEIWRFIKEQDNGITNFHFEISADLLNEEELQLISDMRPGLIQLEIGVQSTNPFTIHEIKRTMKFKRLKEVVQKIQSFGNIHQHLDLIAGLPSEDYAIFQKSFDDVYELQPEQLQLGFLKVLKGSYMYEHAEEYGILYHKYAPYEVFSTNWLSYNDILRLKRIEEVLEVYYNSRQFEITMQVLQTGYESAFQMFEQLGDFYEEKGYFHMSHSRIRRAEILIEFVMEKCKDTILPIKIIDCIKEALIFDLYYRENCKSRPNWAIDAGTFKEMTRFYCKNGKQSHIEPFHYDFLEMHGTLPKYCKTPQWILFSYEKRNPLTHQAQVERVVLDTDILA